MRNLVIAASVALIVAVIPDTLLAQGSPKIGFVNSSVLLAGAPGRAEAESKLKTEMTASQAELQRMSDSLQAMGADFDNSVKSLDSATRVARFRIIQDREAVYQARARALDSTMQLRQAAFIRPIMENVQKIVEQVRKEDGYAIIFDLASQTSGIIAVDKTLDITPKVLMKVKASGPPKTVGSTLSPSTNRVLATSSPHDT